MRRQKILGLIPARSGSKGIPGKNVRVLGDKPLIAHTIDAARAAECLDRVVVSTDAPFIAEIAKRHSAEVPWLRPAELATDTASILDVVLHSLEMFRSVEQYSPDAVMVLQPTSPFRSASTIRAAVEMYGRSSGESVVSVSVARDHPHWCKRVTPAGILQPWDPQAQVPNTRQELPPAYCVNGVLYLASVATLRTRRSLYGEQTRALIVPEEESLDLDTLWDWRMAECFWSLSRGRVQATVGATAGDAR